MSIETKSGQDVHRYLECGLDNVWLEGGFHKVTGPDGKEFISITDLPNLHRCIANCLIQKTSLLTGAEFRFLRTELDLSQTTMASLCGRQERILRDWEAGETVEEPANTIIRFVYEQRFNPSAKFEVMSKQIRQLQELDKQLHELKLKNTQQGWIACEHKKAA